MIDNIIDCPRCGGYGQMPMGRCSVCNGKGSSTRKDIIENYQYLKHSHEECWGTEFVIPSEYLPENNPDYNGDVFDHKF